MLLEQLAQLGEFVGAVAVVISLGYVAFQVRQNTKQLELSAELAQAEAEVRNSNHAADFTALVVADPELSELWRRGLRESAPLTEAEQFRFGMVLGTMFYRLEGLYDQNQRGLLSDDSWKPWEDLIVTTQRRPAGQRWWAENVFPLSPEFRAHVDRLVAERGLKPSPPPPAPVPREASA